MMSRWVRVVPTDALIEGRGVGGLVGDACVAVFRLPGGKFAVVGGIDPHSGANVMAHGLTGSVEVDGVSVAFVASPLDKRRYRLDTGDAIEPDAPGIGCWPFRVVDDIVEVAPLLDDPRSLLGV
jgi:nitrite reductase (NADH) small subunit